MIFDDEKGIRWKTIKICFFTMLIAILSVISIYFLNQCSIMYTPIISQIIVQTFEVIKILFIYYLLITIVLGFLRMAIMFFFTNRQIRRKKIIRNYLNDNRISNRNYMPTVSVIVPIYNEAVVIKNTILALLNSDYPIREIIIIDDGSTDETVKILENEFFRNGDISLIQKQNGGKSSALNLGIEYARGEIIVTIDADTVFTKSTIANLVRNFSDPQVAAVSGNCKIGNLKNQLTIWQHIEYVTSNNIDKRAFEELNAITVVPGSNSAWRKSTLKKLGFYESDTLAEDTELTLRLINAGYKIVYEDRAISYEECPEKFKDFLKQRNRWTYGILQAVWKHRKNFYKSSNKSLKYFAVPSLLFTYLLLLTSPIVDIIFILSLLTGTTTVLYYTFLFYLTDFLNSFVAFRIEKERMKPLIWVFVQRLAYRYLLAYVTWKSVLQALKGNRVGWKTMNRFGSNKFKI